MNGRLNAGLPVNMMREARVAAEGEVWRVDNLRALQRDIDTLPGTGETDLLETFTLKMEILWTWPLHLICDDQMQQQEARDRLVYGRRRNVLY